MSAAVPTLLDTPLSHEAQVRALQDVGALFYQRGWSVGTSSNYSVVLSRDPLRLLVTASGKDKRRLTDEDFVVVDEAGKPLDADGPPASAETLLHVVAARQPGVGAVLHTHSVWSTVLTDDGTRAIDIDGYEMLKGLAGVTTHETRVHLPVFENTQDIPALARQVKAAFTTTREPPRYGYLIRRHGLYTWGRDLNEARRHVEVLEFLLEVLGRRRGMR